jgi:prepilin-type N-terminal cleavage/methylation domain-containing protein
MELRAKGPRAGFTLIEVLIALVVLSVALVGLIPMLIHTIRGNTFGRTATEAATYSQDALEELRRAPFADLVAQCGSQTADIGTTGLRRGVVIQNADGDPGCDTDILVIEVCTAEAGEYDTRCFGANPVASHHFFAVRARY